jgi:hypothetical protein
MTTGVSVGVAEVADDGRVCLVMSSPVVGAVTVTGTGRIDSEKTTAALPLHVVEDRCGRAVLMHGGTGW